MTENALMTYLRMKEGESISLQASRDFFGPLEAADPPSNLRRSIYANRRDFRVKMKRINIQRILNVLAHRMVDMIMAEHRFTSSTFGKGVSIFAPPEVRAKIREWEKES